MRVFLQLVRFITMCSVNSLYIVLVPVLGKTDTLTQTFACAGVFQEFLPKLALPENMDIAPRQAEDFLLN